MRKKQHTFSETDFRNWSHFDSSELVKTEEDYLHSFARGEEQARIYLSHHSQFSLQNMQGVHSYLYGGIFGSSGELRDGFDPMEFEVANLQELGEITPDMTPEEQFQRIAEQHIEMVELNAFPYGNQEVANLMTERRMIQAFGEHMWQGLDQIDSQKWDQAVERGDAKILAGFLSDQLQDARSFEQNPLQEFQNLEPGNHPSPDGSPKRDDWSQMESEREARIGALEEEAKARIENYQIAERESVDLSQSTLPSRDNLSQIVEESGSNSGDENSAAAKAAQEEAELLRAAQEQLDQLNEVQKKIEQTRTLGR